MTVFVDTSAWFAAANARDRHHVRAGELLLAQAGDLVTSTFVLVETWLLLQSKMNFAVAEQFAEFVRSGAARLEHSTMDDLQSAWEIAEAFSDQRFSLVDRASFAMMERLAVSKVVSFDDDFIVYRFDPDRRRAFEVLR
jgi:predicted nucleic acid-binding protein